MGRGWTVRVRVGALALVVASCSSGQGASPPTASPSAPDAGTSASVEPDAPEARTETDHEVIKEANLAYTSEMVLDVYRPAGPGPWPVAVFFHGGADVKATHRFFTQAIAAAGVVVLAPQWRSYPEQIEADARLALQDGACAMRFARARVEEFGGDPSRVVATGWSLGGNVAAVMAVAPLDAFAGDCVVSGDVSLRADGVVGLDATYDAEAIMDPDELGDTPGYPAFDVHDYLADPDELDPVPFVIYTGQIDELVQQGEALRDHLLTIGWEVDYERLDLSHSAFMTNQYGQLDAIVALASGAATD